MTILRGSGRLQRRLVLFLRAALLAGAAIVRSPSFSLSSSSMNTLADGLFVLAAAFGSLMLVGCGRAPSVDVFGAFFPAGLICFAIGILLAVICRALLQRRVEIAFPILVYPSLTAIITFALWLALFR